MEMTGEKQDLRKEELQKITDEMIRNKVVSGGDPVEALIAVVDIAIGFCMNNPILNNSLTKSDGKKIEKIKNEFFGQIAVLKHSQ
ncbi:MAG TPA: hypothetical protein PLA41_02870 [Candidatus Pacearchaeota archaeon]|nr:hypothetical protein [Candidatus Pacearchaeota archaeon]HOU46064.1 hypothetical protein [Candidatus Pacearchaeota archaeon]HPM08607.1 hypothetical protein [Candidatus Pacearchaeota archaeon]HQI74777.1 hypothetical protein [Candidatus Pacearchaeota archaeon]